MSVNQIGTGDCNTLHPKRRSLLPTESEDSTVLFQVTFLNSDEFVTAYACCFCLT